MPAFEHRDSLQRLSVTVLDEHDARVDAIAEHCFESSRERGGGFACAGDQDSATAGLWQRQLDRSAGTEVAPHVRSDCRIGDQQVFAARSTDCRVEQRDEQLI